MRTTIISALFLLGATPIALAQGGYGPVPAPLDRSGMLEGQVTLPPPNTPGTVAGAPKVELYFVEPSMAFAPGLVELRGNNLHLVRQVLVGGAEVPIVFNNGRRMLIAPENQAPGFANLELIRVGGRLDTMIEFTPSVRAEWRNGRARVQIHPNMEGWHMVLYSFRRLDTPITYANTYGAAMLDLSGAQCGTLCSGLQPGHEPVTLPWMRVPTGPNLMGPMHVQGLVLVGGQTSYTNTVTIQPHL